MLSRLSESSGDVVCGPVTVVIRRKLYKAVVDKKKLTTLLSLPIRHVEVAWQRVEVMWQPKRRHKPSFGPFFLRFRVLW